jgi:uncharacterized protein
MSLKETIKSDLINAQKEADRAFVAILKLLWSEIGYLTVDGKDDDKGVLAMLKKEARKRKDAVLIYKKAGDKQRVENEEYELKVISAYLPEEMGEEEIRKVVEEVAKESGLSGGQLIGAAMKKLGGKADGTLVAKIVGEI